MRAEPVSMLERGAMPAIQAQCGLPPVTHEIDRDSRRAGHPIIWLLDAEKRHPRVIQ
jgi:hypothetical protein